MRIKRFLVVFDHVYGEPLIRRVSKLDYRLQAAVLCETFPPSEKGGSLMGEDHQRDSYPQVYPRALLESRSLFSV